MTFNSGLAALTTCKAPLLALNDDNILPKKEIMGVLNYAEIRHEKADDGGGADSEMHKAVAASINRIIAGAIRCAGHIGTPPL